MGSQKKFHGDPMGTYIRVKWGPNGDPRYLLFTGKKTTLYDILNVGQYSMIKNEDQNMRVKNEGQNEGRK